MLQRHAKTDRAPVILQIKRVVRQTHRLREILNHGSDVVEAIVEPLRVRPIAMAEAWVIGRNKMKMIGKPK